ncbi:unnamed protein product [Closterium sp. NIES-53]
MITIRSEYDVCVACSGHFNMLSEKVDPPGSILWVDPTRCFRCSTACSAPQARAVSCLPRAPNAQRFFFPSRALRRAAVFCPVEPSCRPLSPDAARATCARPARGPYGLRQPNARPVRAAPGPRAARAARARVWGWRVWGCCVCEPSPSPPPPPPPSPTAAAAAEGGGYVGAVGVFRGGWRVSSARGAAGSV